MNVRLKKSYQFSVGIFLDGQFFIQDMTCVLEFYSNTMDSVSQNVAVERWAYFFNHVLNGAVLVDSEDTARISALQDLNIRVIDLPNEAYDQIVGIALYLKLNTISEQQLIVTDVSICSDQGQYVYYLHNENESTGPLDHDRGWWVENSPSYCNIKHTADKVVKLAHKDTWRDLDLEFPRKDDSEVTVKPSTVLHFRKNES